MKRDKLKLYVLELILFTILFTALFVSSRITYPILALILLVYMVLLKIFIKKKSVLSIYKKQVALLMIAFGLIYLGGFFSIGMFINDFAKQPITFSSKALINYIIPLIIIIFSSEVIRSSLLMQDGKIRLLKKEVDLSKILTFINLVLVDLIIYIGVYNLRNLDEFLTAIGFVLFASVSCNLFYNYVSKRYGILGIIGYRMITVLYSYIIPIVPNIYIYFRSFLRMIYPYVLYLILEKTYSKTDFVVAYKDKRKNIIGITIMVVIMALVTMLISCQFRFGILVIGSGSMKGALNIGDAVVFEQYESQLIQKGQVIIFEKNGLNLVHRVMEIENVNGELRYYTKGDANKEMDVGYVTSDKIVGVTRFRIMYIGYPTIWMRNLFS